MVIESANSGKPQKLDVSNRHAGRMGYLKRVFSGGRTGITNTWSRSIMGKIVDRHLASTWI